MIAIRDEKFTAFYSSSSFQHHNTTIGECKDLLDGFDSLLSFSCCIDRMFALYKLRVLHTGGVERVTKEDEILDYIRSNVSGNANNELFYSRCYKCVLKYVFVFHDNNRHGTRRPERLAENT